MNDKEKELMREWLRHLIETDEIFDWIRPKMMDDKLVELKVERKLRLQTTITNINNEIKNL
ncbi:MAG: hypothetical protein BWY74_00774 [Firmicutes bacterium ADurb.Bin419]|nr:MAG: hypothetical protein BWY74_00774 [Firmicutes bacterium ADurb.Bin419]